MTDVILTTDAVRGVAFFGLSRHRALVVKNGRVLYPRSHPCSRALIHPLSLIKERTFQSYVCVSPFNGNDDDILSEPSSNNRREKKNVGGDISA